MAQPSGSQHPATGRRTRPPAVSRRRAVVSDDLAGNGFRFFKRRALDDGVLVGSLRAQREGMPAAAGQAHCPGRLRRVRDAFGEPGYTPVFTSACIALTLSYYYL